MKSYRHIVIILGVFLGAIYGNSFGYLRIVEATICMDDCSQYMLEGESGDFIEYIYPGDIDLGPYINRYVEVVSVAEYDCLMCSATVISSIQISDYCDYPTMCFVSPCLVAEECQLNTPVDCIDNYCGGCNADFYDMEGNLVDCYNTPIEECMDLEGIFFGVCEMFMGYAYINGGCQGVSGCGWNVDGIDYSNDFFNTLGDCEETCIDTGELTCDEIESEYENIHSGMYDNCIEDSDCVTIWGNCDVGLGGGCHYSVNDNLFDYEYSNDLVDIWINDDCMQWVCDCIMPPPNSICNNGECELTYCEGPNPAGCFQNGCNDGYECIDFGNSDYAEFCTPSSCGCDESYIYNSSWFCTEDCNGGTCVPENPEPGDVCVLEDSTIGLNVPGFVDCDGECMDYEYYAWVGDGWCDEGAWGISLVCEALDCDGGDCPGSWCGCIAGDVNDDEIVNIIDIVLIIGCILDGNNSCNCSDVNHDGNINIVDIVILVNMIMEP
tara:strand:+ start:783 stop:2264 length:1482 start_codon:yes stop_codon:yes gene_type:complete